MTGLEREVARRRRQAARETPSEPSKPVERCSAGSEAARCCVGDPWADINPYYDDPLMPEVIRVAAACGVDPHALDHHVEGVHGVEPHNEGYAEAVEQAARCMAAGGCEGGAPSRSAV